MNHCSGTPNGARMRPLAITATRSARLPMPTSPLRPISSAFARAYETRKEPATATTQKMTAMSSPARANTKAIAASTNPSLTRSESESRNSPNGVALSL